MQNSASTPRAGEKEISPGEGTSLRWRLFMAVPLPAPVREAMRSVQRELEQKWRCNAAWTRPERMHLTLVFIGDVPVARVDPLRAALAAEAAPVTPFELEVRGCGVFGPPCTPRILWAGIPQPPEGLTRLRAACEAAAAETGCRLEARAFRPHLTLGRFRAAPAARWLTEGLASLQDTPFGMVPVRRVELMRSRPEPPGADYEVLSSVTLKGA